MKLLPAFALTLITLPILAQTPAAPPDAAPPAASPSAPAAPPPNASSMADQVTSVLTPAEKTQLTDVRTKAMAANPDLQAQQMDLMQKVAALQGGTATDADKTALRGEAMQFQQKVRAAMVKIDPTVEPVLEKVEAQIAKLRAQYQAPQ
jgi:hypothetical protein